MSDEKKTPTVTAKCGRCGHKTDDISDLLRKMAELQRERDRLLDRQARNWILSGDRIMSVIIPNALTKRDMEKIKRYIVALEFEASIAWEDVEGVAIAGERREEG